MVDHYCMEFVKNAINQFYHRKPGFKTDQPQIDESLFLIDIRFWLKKNGLSVLKPDLLWFHI